MEGPTKRPSLHPLPPRLQRESVLANLPFVFPRLFFPPSSSLDSSSSTYFSCPAVFGSALCRCCSFGVLLLLLLHQLPSSWLSLYSPCVCFFSRFRCSGKTFSTAFFTLCESTTARHCHSSISYSSSRSSVFTTLAPWLPPTSSFWLRQTRRCWLTRHLFTM